MRSLNFRSAITLVVLSCFAVTLAACGGQETGSATSTSQAPTTPTAHTAKPVGTTDTTAPPRRHPTATTRPKSPPTTTTTRLASAGPCVAGFVCGHVTAIGDSVMLDAQPDLQKDIPGIDVEAAVSRQWDAGMALAQEMKADRTLGSIVVIDLGTNGPVTLEQFEQMMTAVAGASVVVFVTVHLPPSYSWSQSVNGTLEQGVRLYKNTRLADFNALADANPEWFGSDGVHMPIGGTGAQAMAILIASKI